MSVPGKLMFTAHLSLTVLLNLFPCNAHQARRESAQGIINKNDYHFKS